ncbi:hypothetical protein RAD16_08170 [Bradyrhizobium sp. 18BD]
MATMFKLRAFEGGLAGRALARINSVGIVQDILFIGDGNSFTQTRYVFRLLQQVAIALQRALRLDFSLRAECRTDAGDDVAELF